MDRNGFILVKNDNMVLAESGERRAEAWALILRTLLSERQIHKNVFVSLNDGDVLTFDDALEIVENEYLRLIV